MTSTKYKEIKHIFDLYEKITGFVDPFDYVSLSEEEKEKEEELFYNDVINGKIPYYTIEFLIDCIEPENFEIVKSVLMDIIHTTEKHAKQD